MAPFREKSSFDGLFNCLKCNGLFSKKSTASPSLKDQGRQNVMKMKSLNLDLKIEKAASYLRYVVLFGAPLIFIGLLFLVIVSIYIARPYANAKSFTQTTCWVEYSKIHTDISASCSAGTDVFKPCVKVFVSYATGGIEGIRGAVIMENEQALIDCNQCSYTFGRQSLFLPEETTCQNWREDLNISECVNSFLNRYGKQNDSYSCYFNPLNHSQVIRNLQLDLNVILHSYAWPVSGCLLYVLIFAFVSYSDKQKKLRRKIILSKMRREVRLTAERRKTQLGQCLGVVSTSEWKNKGTTKKNSLRRFSLTLETTDHAVMSSPTMAIPEAEEYSSADEPYVDMRHLDLAVTEQNIDDLATTFAYYASTSPGLDTTRKSSRKWSENLYSTLPVTLRPRKSAHSVRAYTLSAGDNLGYLNDVFESGDSQTTSTDAVSITTSAMLSEQDIDVLYTAVHKRRYEKVKYKKSETTV